MKKIIALVGIIISVSSCSSDKAETIKKYDSKGRLVESYFVDDNGKKNGIYFSYFDNGNIKEKKNIKGDKLNGYYFLYYDTGILKSKSKYLNDILIDTTWHYRASGVLEASVVYDIQSQEMKDLFYYPNGKIKTSRSFFIGTGRINAFQTFSETGRCNTNFKESKYLNLIKTSMDSISMDFIGLEFNEHDSIIVNYVDNFDFVLTEDAISFRKEHYGSSNGKLRIQMDKSDFHDGMLNLQIDLYTTTGVNEIAIQGYSLQLYEGESLPKNSLHPIILN